MKGNGTIKFKKVLFLSLGILALIYYGICIAFAHVGVSWLWIWPALACFCFIRYFMLKKNVRVPGIIRAVYGVLIALFLVSFALIEGMIISCMNSTPPDNLDYIVVLGAAIRNGMATTPMQQRMDAALEYLEENRDTRCIASGGQGSNEFMPEAQFIADYLIDNGIDKERVIDESRSTDTEENLRYSFEHIEEGRTIGIVSSTYHLFRAKLIAKSLGREVSPVPARTYAILGVHYTVREYFAVVEFLMKGGAGASAPVPII